MENGKIRVEYKGKGETFEAAAVRTKAHSKSSTQGIQKLLMSASSGCFWSQFHFEHLRNDVYF